MNVKRNMLILILFELGCEVEVKVRNGRRVGSVRVKKGVEKETKVEEAVAGVKYIYMYK